MSLPPFPLIAMNRCVLKRLFVTIMSASALLAVDAYAQDLTRYDNERYGFSMLYPSDFVMDEPPVNGDGRVFKKGDACSVAGFGYNNTLDETVRARTRSMVKEFDRITRRASGRGWVEISGFKGKQSLHIKSFIGRRSVNELHIRQPASGDACKVPVANIAHAFRPGALNEFH